MLATSRSGGYLCTPQEIKLGHGVKLLVRAEDAKRAAEIPAPARRFECSAALFSPAAFSGNLSSTPRGYPNARPSFAHVVVMLHLIMCVARGIVTGLIRDPRIGGPGLWSAIFEGFSYL
jgi:hypothetical protein